MNNPVPFFLLIIVEAEIQCCVIHYEKLASIDKCHLLFLSFSPNAARESVKIFISLSTQASQVKLLFFS